MSSRIARASDRQGTLQATLHGVVFDILGTSAAVGHAAGPPGPGLAARWWPRSSSPGSTGRPSTPRRQRSAATLRRTGYPACAGYDGLFW